MIPVPMSVLEDPSAHTTPSTTNDNPIKEPQQQRRPSSFMKKLKGGGGEKKAKKEDFKMVKMTRGEYLMYWAKDEEGRYIGTEPEGEGVQRLRERGEL